LIVRDLLPRKVAKVVDEATRSTIADFKEGVIADEVSMTGNLVGAIRSSLDGRQIGKCRWRARVLKTARGRGAEESRHGADVLGVLEIDLPNYEIKKGFLLQSKIIEPDSRIDDRKWREFQRQCNTMRQRTDHAFAMIFSREKGVRFIPAQEILSIDKTQVYSVGSRSIFGFFEDHVKCQVGDQGLDSPTIETLDELVQPAEREALIMKASRE
jgi:hypothetical protein